MIVTPGIADLPPAARRQAYIKDPRNLELANQMASRPPSKYGLAITKPKVTHRLFS